MQQFLPFLLIVCAALIVCVLVQFALITSLNARFARQTKMLRQFFSGPQGEDLEALLERTLTQSTQAMEQSELALERVTHEAARNASGLQKFALHRYDAFEDVTGEQSFSLALLDGNGNGTVITSILGRQNSRCFGKAIVNGQPMQPLSEEEQRVFLQACQSNSEFKVDVAATAKNRVNGDKSPNDSRAEQAKNNQVALEASRN